LYCQPNSAVISFLKAVRGDYFAAGAFTEISSVPVTALTKITQTGTNATLSTQFDTVIAGDAATVNSLYQQDDGKLLFAGAFTSVNGQLRERIARISESPAEANALNLPVRTIGVQTEWDFTTRTARYVPGGLNAELERAPTLLIASSCCDSSAFAPVAGARAVRESLATQAWVKTNVPTTSATFYLRWRYEVRDARGGTSLYESPILRIVPRSPKLSFTPAPNAASNTIVFPSGAAGAGLRQIMVSPSGTEGGTTALTQCQISNIVGTASFDVVRAVPANFTWERTAGLVELRCTRTAQLTTARVSCAQQASDNTPLAPVTWGLTCPAANTVGDAIFANGFE
jgi:hypothetical protein